MRLLTCQKLSKDDVTEIQKYVRHADSLIGEKMISEMDDVEDAFKRDHVAALGYMLQQGYLEMKIAVLYDTDAESRKVGSLKNAILHQKSVSSMIPIFMVYHLVVQIMKCNWLA